MPEARIYSVKEKKGKEVVTPVRGARVTHNEGERIFEPGTLHPLRGIRMEHEASESGTVEFKDHVGNRKVLIAEEEHYFEKRGRRYLLIHSNSV